MIAEAPLDQLYRRPGFMIRRAHQIAVSLFLEETGALGITNRQYGIMARAQSIGITRHRSDHRRQAAGARPLHHRHGAGKAGGRGPDRPRSRRSDRRKRSLELTPAGERMLTRLAEPARRAQERVLSAFSPRSGRCSSICWKNSPARSTTPRACRRWCRVQRKTHRRHSGAPRSGEPEGSAIIARLCSGLRLWHGSVNDGRRGSYPIWLLVVLADTSPRSPRGWPTTRRRIFSRSPGTRGCARARKARPMMCGCRPMLMIRPLVSPAR